MAFGKNNHEGSAVERNRTYLQSYTDAKLPGLLHFTKEEWHPSVFPQLPPLP